MKVVVNSNVEEIADWRDSILNRSDCIVHNIYVCESKLYRLSRIIKTNTGYMSPSELARRILLNEY